MRIKFSIVAAIPNEQGILVSLPIVDHNQHTFSNGEAEKAEERRTRSFPSSFSSTLELSNEVVWSSEVGLWIPPNEIGQLLLNVSYRFIYSASMEAKL